MKSLTNILRRSDLNPLERVTALVHNNVHKDKTGKSILSEAEVRSIAELWVPRHNYEVRQYNKYQGIARLETSMRIDAQMYLYQSDRSLLGMHRILDRMTMHYTNLDDINTFDSSKNSISQSESVKFFTQHSYMEYQEIIHRMTFHNLPATVQKDLKIIDDGIEMDSIYFHQEVLLYEVFDGKKSLDSDQKKRLVGIIYESIYDEKLRERRGGAEKDGIRFQNYFAGLSVTDILYKCADYLHVTYNKGDESHLKNLLNDLERHADSKKTSMEHIIKSLLLRWFDDGLFVSEYIPLCHSDGTNTWNGTTKKTHKENFKSWYQELQKSKSCIQELIDQGSLVRETMDHYLLGPLDIITGQSIYLCSEDEHFINEYKEQVNLMISISNTFLFAQKYSHPVKSYVTLSQFIEIAKEFSQLFDIDMTEKYVEYRDEYDEQILLINMSFLKLLAKLHEYLCEYKSWKYIIDIDMKGYMFDVGADGDVDEIANMYKEQFDKMNK